MSAPDEPPVRYPLPPPDRDERFNVGLTLDLVKVLEQHGYTGLRVRPDHVADDKPTVGGNLTDLQNAMFRFLYEQPPSSALLEERYPGVADALAEAPGDLPRSAEAAGDDSNLGHSGEVAGRFEPGNSGPGGPRVDPVAAGGVVYYSRASDYYEPALRVPGYVHSIEFPVGRHR